MAARRPGWREARHDPFRARPRLPDLGDRAPLDGRRPRVLAHVHKYPPGHNAGAEVMLHAMLRHLIAAGWDARVLATEYRGRPYALDGVMVTDAGRDADLAEPYRWCDVAVTHLDATRRAIPWARKGRPLVHVVHNHAQLSHHRVRPGDASLVVWNSRWVAEHWASWPGRSIITRPPVLSSDYRVADDRHQRERVTLLNLYTPKGAPLFWRMARQRPDLAFLGVRGAYGLQDVPDRVPVNVEVIDNTPAVVADVYARTRVLVVPSSYESWGRVAVEAMASGIPVIAAPTPGLREALTCCDGTPAALFADTGSDQAWLDALASLDVRRTYRRWSDLARRRSAELDVIAGLDLEAWRSALAALAGIR